MTKSQSGKNIIWTDRELRESEAFRYLTKSSLLVLMDFYAKRQVDKKTKKRMTNNGELFFTYAEAEQKGYTRATFQRALDQLIERGFIDVTFTGAGLYKSASQYALSDRWQKFGRSDFVPAERNPHQRNTHHGFQSGSSHPSSPCGYGNVKNVITPDNGDEDEIEGFVIRNDNSESMAVISGDN